MFINESLLSFLWQHAIFDQDQLKTTAGHSLRISSTGHLNRHAGPDFLEARIRVDGLLWAGAVEIHVRASEWYEHDHQHNPDYDRVILHVVWEDDALVSRQDGSLIYALALKDRVSPLLIRKYRNLIYAPSMDISCGPQLEKVDKAIRFNMIYKALTSRLERKSGEVLQLLREARGHWQEVTYQLFVRNFGFKVNQENMLLLAKFLPYQLISRHADNTFQLEALFFGMAGFLEKADDQYQKQLKDEFEYLKKKYRIRTGFMQRYQWKFLRLRPQNFPTVRIAQLAIFLSLFKNIFSMILGVNPRDHLLKEVPLIQSPYWVTHYDFGKKASQPLAGLGETSKNNILINTFVPLLVAYAQYADDDSFTENAIRLLENLAPENNDRIRKWARLGVRPENAAESQGLIELYNGFCYKKQCLNCNIGTDLILKTAPVSGDLP